MLPVTVNVLLPDKVNGVPLPVKVTVSESISRFWDASTVMDVAVIFEFVLNVVAVPFTEIFIAPKSWPAVLSVSVCVLPLEKVNTPEEALV